MRKGLFIANFWKYDPLGHCSEPTQNVLCRDLTFSEYQGGQKELLNKGIVTRKKDRSYLQHTSGHFSIAPI